MLQTISTILNQNVSGLKSNDLTSHELMKLNSCIDQTASVLQDTL